MKNYLAGMAIAGIVGVAALSGCVPATTQLVTEASVGTVYEADIIYGDLAEETGVSVEWTDMPEFMHFSGTIAARQSSFQFGEEREFSAGDMFFVLVEGDVDEDGYTPKVHFIIDRDTVLLLNTELEPGVAVKGFYETGGYMIRLNYPLHHARVLVSDPMSLDPNAPFQNDVIVDRFDEHWMAHNHLYPLQLEIGGYTEITFQDGQPFEGELDELINRALVAWGGARTRVVPGYPNIAWPENIDILWDNMLASDVQVFVNGEAVEMPKPFVNREAGFVMVPIVYIAEALGFNVYGEGENIVIELDQAAFIIDGDNSHLTGIEPLHELHDGVLFVPLDFFGRMLPPAYIMDGNIFVNDFRDSL